MMKKLILTQVILLLTFGTLYAQDNQNPNREIGIRLTSLTDFGFIYKKQKAPNTFSRMRVANMRVGFKNIEGAPNPFNLSMGFSYGREKRKSINEKFSFIGGWEVAGYFSSAFQNPNSNLKLTPSIGMVLGFQYKLNESFLINLETIPSLSSRFESNNNDINLTSVNLGFNSNALALGFLYWF
ncbi:MAG: hypothetical protein ACWA41_02825 [Putridiphycobacter sp.]